MNLNVEGEKMKCNECQKEVGDTLEFENVEEFYIKKVGEGGKIVIPKKYVGRKIYVVIEEKDPRIRD